jgi:hypothetical protein
MMDGGGWWRVVVPAKKSEREARDGMQEAVDNECIVSSLFLMYSSLLNDLY